MESLDDNIPTFQIFIPLHKKESQTKLLKAQQDSIN